MRFENRGKRARRKPAGKNARGWRRRLAGFELLEDRQLLAMITVNTLVDENNGIGSGGVSLREAVAAAQANDTITFSVTGTINLTSAGSGHISVTKNLTIQGPGANLLTIKAYDPDSSGTNDGDGRRVFLVSNNSSSLINVTISGLRLTNGDPDVSDDDDSEGGGAVHNLENLSIINCVLTGNYSLAGGAILNSSGTLSITDSVIDGNVAQDGGGIMIDGGTLSLTRTTISNNQATNAGAGILNRNRTITVTDSTISGNTAVEHGGGIYQYQGNLTVNGSTISGNESDSNDDQVGSGGGIYNLGGGLTITSSTISDNESGEDGGGIFNDTSQTLNIKHSTIFGNSVTNHSGNEGGGIRSPDPVVLNHTIVAGNLKGSTRDDVSGSFTAGYSLIGDRRSTSVTNSGGSLIGTSSSPINAMLGSLANNGGPTKTHSLLVGSPAIDAGNMSAAAGVSGIPQYDQRGTPYSRVLDFDGVGGARIDIGAAEMSPPVPALLGDYNRNNAVDAGDFVLWRNTMGTSVPVYSGADGNGNAMIDAGDFGVWRAHFGQVLMPAAGSAVSTAESDAISGNNYSAAAAAPAESGNAQRSAGSAFKREVLAPAAGTALDLLLMLDPAYSPGDARYGSFANAAADEAIDEGPAFDIALEESLNAMEAFHGGAR
jgi:hypothetical protein